LEVAEWAAKKIARARGILQPYSPPEEIYLAFLVYRLTPIELDDLIMYLKFSRQLSRILHDTLSLKIQLAELDSPEAAPSRVYRVLHQFRPTAILANLLAADSPVIRGKIESYLKTMRSVQPALTGDDLKDLGIHSGPRIKETLDLLLEARLDGEVETRQDEIQMVEKMVKAGQ